MSDLQPDIKQGKQVVGNDALERFAVVVAKAYSQAIELGPAEKRLTLRFKIVGEFANKENRADFSQRNFNVLPVRGQEVDGIVLAQAHGIQIAAKGLLVGKHNNDLLVRGGWGAILQNLAVPGREWSEFANRQNVCYVKRVFLSTHCFH